MRVVVTGGLVAIGFSLWPSLGALDSTVAVLLAVAVGMLIAVLVADDVGPFVLVAGALAPLAMECIPSFAVACGVATALVYASRAWRARALWEASIVLALALTSGALAGALVAGQALAAIELRATAWVVASVLAMVPFSVKVDDVLTARLRRMLLSARPELRATLLRALAVRRRALPASMIDEASAEAILRAWRSFARLVEAMSRMPGAHLATLKEHAHEHVRALVRVDRAARSAFALAAGLDRSGIDRAHNVRDRLEAEVAALEEVVAGKDGLRASPAPSPSPRARELSSPLELPSRSERAPLPDPEPR